MKRNLQSVQALVTISNTIFMASQYNPDLDIVNRPTVFFPKASWPPCRLYATPLRFVPQQLGISYVIPRNK